MPAQGGHDGSAENDELTGNNESRKKNKKSLHFQKKAISCVDYFIPHQKGGRLC